MEDKTNLKTYERGWLVIPKGVRGGLGESRVEWKLNSRLRAARTHLGLTQRDVATHLHIHRSTYLSTNCVSNQWICFASCRRGSFFLRGQKETKEAAGGGGAPTPQFPQTP